MTATPTVASAAVITASGNSAVQVVPTLAGVATVGIILAATAVTGTSPSLTATVQWSADGTNFYAANPADSFPAVTAVGGTAQAVTVKAPYWRLSYAVTGTTPSFTVTVTAYYA